MKKPEDWKLIKEWFSKKVQFKLLYSTLYDGISGEIFHKKCDN